ncbi:sensor histidine kinase [Paeniglutamicibacter cryotolerans]|uniref:histidine kinase n=1 Tax=Paeniglutamicibacter cryotolerans TaxID=670079 RepID=A0A839QU32_9MICC|nr:histidine kinase [Paeniglutamicibacter cryotolerans]MBB2997476.1 signal transduction histidine kinase [Paeniglutamicibacter cryotolerans]
MTPHRTLDRWIREHPKTIDLLLALGLLAIALPATLSMGGTTVNGSSATLLAVPVTILQILPLAWRRSRPATAAAIITAAHLIQVIDLHEYLFSQVSVPIVIYSLAVYGKRWQSFAGLITGFIGAILATAAFSGGGGWATELLISFAGLALIVLVAWTFGDLARTRRLAMQTLEDRARRLEVERQQERDLAAADERSHIAREMHDIVAHSLSVIITQADGARYASEHDPGIARETLATISATGRGSLREMRRLLGVLRGDEVASTRPLPSLGDVPDLIEASRKAGLAIDYTATGSPRRSLPAGAELTAYRAVQESLTNVIKHGGPAAAAGVALAWTGRGLELLITDDGRGAGALGDPADSGQGLNGMIERVGLYDGFVEAGPAEAGGFRVHVAIPYTED